MQSLKDQVIVITGAASGIGRALSLDAARQGARLLLADIDAARLADTLAEVRALGARAESQVTDSGREDDLHALAAACERHYGGVDVLVNNAGVALVSSVERLQPRDAHWLMDINFWGVVHGCRAFLPLLRRRPEAVIVNISSIFAMISVPTQSIYNAAKAAVRAFSDALREELRDSPVRVLCVHPGGIRTRIVENARMADLSMLQLSATQMRDQFAANARTTPEEAARQIVAAVLAGRTRLLIGPDARIADWLYRLWPARASRWISAMGERRRQKALLSSRGAVTD